MSIAISLHVKGEHVILVGGGKVAYRKAIAFLKEGAIVTIIAPQVSKDLQKIASIQILNEAFSWELVQDVFLLYVATNDIALNDKIVQEAKNRGILCGCATHCEDVHFSSMMQMDYEHLQVAISTKTTFPYANKVFLKELQPQLEIMNQKLKSLQIIRKYILSKKIENPELYNTLMASQESTLCIIAKAIREHKKMIILAYHGVADVSVVEADMKDMITLCEDKFASSLFINAFISEKIQSKARRKGYFVEDLQRVVQLCINLSLTYAIQPMLISNGTFMKTLKFTYETSQLGKVLCDTQEDVGRIVSSLLKLYNQPLCLLYHASDSELTYQLKQIKDIDSYTYDEESPRCPQTRLYIQPFSVFIGYHAHKDIVKKWLPNLQEQEVETRYHEHGLLHYRVVREMFIEKIKHII